VNANTGEIAWQTTLGINEALPEGKQRVGGSGNGSDRNSRRAGLHRRSIFVVRDPLRRGSRHPMIGQTLGHYRITDRTCGSGELVSEA
jgi:hypothetical protein